MKRISLFFAASLLCMTGFAQQRIYTLEQILEAATENNIAIRSADYDAQAAAQQRKEAFTKFFPQISATGLWFNANKGMAQMDINLSEQITPEIGAALGQILPPEALYAMSSPISMEMMKNGTIAGVTAVQPIFAGGQIVNGNKLARVAEEASQLQQKLSVNEVELTAEEYFWNLASLQEKEKTLTTVEALLADLEKDVKVAVEAGVAMNNDLLQVRLRQNDIASQRLKLENGIRLIKLLLSQYCGLESEDFAISYEAEPENIRLAEKVDHDQALYSTPEYSLLGKQVEAADLQYKMEIGKKLPSVAVGAGYNYHNLLDNDRSFGMIFATVSIPISDWWGGSHAIKRKQLSLTKAREQLSDKSDLLRIRMQNAWNGVEEAWEQLNLSGQAIDQAKENLRLNVDYYKAGITKMSDLLEAQMLYQQTLDRYTESYSDYRLKVVQYRHSTGN